MKENRIQEIMAHYEEILESLTEEEREEDFVNEDRFVFAQVNRAVKSDSMEPETKEKLESVITLNEEEKKLKSEIKTETALLENNTKEKIENLSDDEVITLLKDKWIHPLMQSLMKLPETIVAEFVRKIEALAQKYEDTLADVEKEIEETQRTLSSMMDDLEGNEFDMQGLQELKKLLGGE